METVSSQYGNLQQEQNHQQVFQNPTRQEIMKLWIMVQRYVKDIIFVLTSNILLNKTIKIFCLRQGLAIT